MHQLFYGRKTIKSASFLSVFFAINKLRYLGINRAKPCLKRYILICIKHILTEEIVRGYYYTVYEIIFIKMFNLGASVGLAMATTGLVGATLWGVMLINIARRRGTIVMVV